VTSKPEIGRLSVQYPGGFSARYRWAGTGRADEVFGVSEGSGALVDYGVEGPALATETSCRAELRVEGPTGSWTARFAAPFFDEPSGVLWDTHGLLLVKYGFVLYAFNGRSGELAWSFVSGTPTLAVLASTRLDHVVLQTELETIFLPLREQLSKYVLPLLRKSRIFQWSVSFLMCFQKIYLVCHRIVMWSLK
jgi:hypothetical protein